MPQPSSVTRIEASPPCRISTPMTRAPASSEFSTSSLTTDAGRSMTSPAAIRAATPRRQYPYRHQNPSAAPSCFAFAPAINLPFTTAVGRFQ